MTKVMLGRIATKMAEHNRQQSDVTRAVLHMFKREHTCEGLC